MKKEFRLNIISIHREICWKDIEIIERRTMSTDSREGEKASECDIFFICKKGCTEKEKKKKKRGIIFYTMHRKRIMLIGYSKEREEELRQCDHGDRSGGLLIGYVGLITVLVVYN